VQMSPGALDAVQQLSALLGAPVATTYLHNDCFPADDEMAVGPLGYQGHEAAMKCVHEADCIIAVGSRMNPFGTLPQYGFDYWPSADQCKLVQIDVDHTRLGLTKTADVYVHGDAAQCTNAILDALRAELGEVACLAGQSKQQRMARVAQHKREWEAKLDEWTFSDVDGADKSKVKPRAALREIERALEGQKAIVSTDIGNICSVSNSYLRFTDCSAPSFLAAMTFGNCQYAVGAAMGAKVATQRSGENRACVSFAGDGAFGMSFNELLTCNREQIPVTAVVFNNGQWGAEKKNQVLWFGDRYIGVNLEDSVPTPNFAEIGRAMGCEAIRVEHVDEVGDAMQKALDLQQNEGKTTIVEVVCTKELGDPFRRDAMKLPKRLLPKYQHTNQVKESATGQPTDM